MLVIQKSKKKSKKTSLPQEIQKLVEEVQAKEEQEIKEVIEEVKKQYKGIWDVKKDEPIEYFDTRLSYELTGYRPINKTEGLDFDPSWFTEARDVFLKTGHYTSYRRGTKAFEDFWLKEYKRCINGLTVNGYTVTGDHYFFLNYYQLMDLSSAQKAGGGRVYAFPTFYVGQYEWFHYVEMAKRLRLNAFLMKSREVGFSEIDAAIIVNSYNSIRNSINLITAHSSDHLDKTLEKVWRAISFINDYTDGGFTKLSQVVNSQYKRRASRYETIGGVKIETGWMSQITGIVADKPSKIRGDRVDLLVYEESGSWPGLIKAFIQSNALVGQPGSQWGYRIGGGTGGDTGPALEGLRKMYYDPDMYGILPFKHNYTPQGDETISAFFIPCTKIMKDKSFFDERGYVDEDKAREYWDSVRVRYSRNPQDLVIQCAEYCYTAEEAFSLEGDNKFNKVNIAEQLVNIRALKKCPHIDVGMFRFNYKGNQRKVCREYVSDVVFNAINTGKVRILEHPTWITNKTEVTNHLYVAGIDGIDIGMGETSELTKDPSDFCMVIKKRIFGNDDPKYVAIYKDRPDDVRQAYEIAIALAMYYNCKINIEATRRGMVTWARDRSFMNYFMRRPSATYNDISRRKTTEIGSPATTQVIDHQTDLIRDFVNDYCHTIWFEDMLVELNQYTIENKRKYDIVAAMGQAELADEELSGVVPKAIVVQEEVVQDIGYYYDENGYKRFGVIPKAQKFETNFKPYIDSDYGTIKTSDPRYYN